MQRLPVTRRLHHWLERRRTRRALSGTALAENNVAEGNVDRLVFHEFFDDGMTERTFVDVGAARPDYLSISALYRKKGWRVIVVEPNPEFASLHRAVGHDVFEYACGHEDRDDCEFSVVDLQDLQGMIYENGQVSFESCSSLAIKPGYDKIIPAGAKIKKIKVRQRRLDSILEEASVDAIDVLSIDVEGWELEVMDGFNFERRHPKVIIIENFLRDPAYDARVEALGYRLWRAPFPNQVFVAR